MKCHSESNYPNKSIHQPNPHAGVSKQQFSISQWSKCLSCILGNEVKHTLNIWPRLKSSRAKIQSKYFHINWKSYCQIYFMVYSCRVVLLSSTIHSNDFTKKPEMIFKIGVIFKIRVTLFFSHAKIMISSFMLNIFSTGWFLLIIIFLAYLTG